MQRCYSAADTPGKKRRQKVDQCTKAPPRPRSSSPQISREFAIFSTFILKYLPDSIHLRQESLRVLTEPSGGFLQQSRDMQIWLIGDFKFPVGVRHERLLVSVCQPCEQLTTSPGHGLYEKIDDMAVKSPYCPLLAGWNIVCKPLLLHVSGWDMDQTKKSKYTNIFPKGVSSIWVIPLMYVQVLIFPEGLVLISYLMGSLTGPCLRSPIPRYTLQCRLWLHMCKMAVFVAGMFWLHFWIVGGSGHMSSIFIYSLWSRVYPTSDISWAWLGSPLSGIDRWMDISYMTFQFGV